MAADEAKEDEETRAALRSLHVHRTEEKEEMSPGKHRCSAGGKLSRSRYVSPGVAVSLRRGGGTEGVMLGCGEEDAESLRSAASVLDETWTKIVIRGGLLTTADCRYDLLPQEGANSFLRSLEMKIIKCKKYF